MTHNQARHSLSAFSPNSDPAANSNSESSTQLPSPRSNSTTSTLNTSYRRNGKLQACEPCRKSKLKCDHVMPICGRCALRNRGRRCIYVDAPVPLPRRKHPHDPPPSLLSPPDSSSSVSASVSLARSASVSEQEPFGLSSPSQSRFDVDPSSSNASITTLTSPPGLTPSSVGPITDSTTVKGRQFYMPHGSLSSKPGFLGATSFNNVFAEDVSMLGIQPVEDEPEELRAIPLRGETFEQAFQVFNFYSDRPLIDRFIRKYYEVCAVGGLALLEPIATTWQELLWDHHEAVLTRQDPEELRALTEKVFQNTATGQKFDQNTTLKEWCWISSGPYLKWEVLGILACIVGLSARTLMRSDPVFFAAGTKIDRNVLAKKCLDVAKICLNFTKTCERLNDVGLTLSRKLHLLLCCIDGEAAPTTYGQAGELMTATIAMGQHQRCDTGETPKWLVEMRRRGLCTSLGAECATSTFLGRPSRLHYKYCKIELPLDLPDSTWVLSPPEIQAAIDRLENGWNPDGRTYRTTWLRIHTDLFRRRQDILDLALMEHTKEEVLYQSERIREHMARDLLKLPPWLQMPATYVRKHSSDPVSSLTMLYHHCTRFGYTCNALLLQRVLVKKGGADPTSLIPPARDAFKDVLNITTKAEMTRDLQNDLSWILVAYGVRTAAILAVELLKQEVLPQQARKLPRSETIQELSVFVATLEALDPTDGHWQLCQQAAKVLKRILDRILSPPTAEISAPATLSTAVNDGLHSYGSGTGLPVVAMEDVLGIDQSGFQFDFHTNVNLATDVDFVNWLETADWDKGLTWQDIPY